jgi:pSer/pThr/pTyr-binding forkhead associated (FHA) protein
MNAAAKVKLLPFELEVVSGPHLGQKFSFVDVASITIGRGTENQICLQHDPRVSRVHIEICQENEVFYVFNKADRNPMFVNRLKETQYKITQACVINVGETEFKFTLPQPTSKQFKNPLQSLAPTKVPVGLVQPQTQAQVPGPVLKQPPPSHFGNQGPVAQNSMNFDAPPAPRRRKGPKKQASFNSVFLIGIVGIIIVAIFVLPSKPDENAKPQKPVEIVTPVFQDDRRYQESVERAKQALLKMENLNSRQAMAQQFFISGMREFLNGNYQRSISFLNSAYQSDPTLVDAEKFARDAQRKLDRLIDFYFAEGLKYRENSNYRMCKSSFQTVQLYIQNNMKHPKFLEAKQFFEECSNLDKVRRF